MSTREEQVYAYDNARAGQRERLRTLEALAPMLLAWLPEPRTALRRLIAALRPGGWLVAEELDFVSAVADPRMDADRRALFARVVDAHNAVLAERNGFDTAYGRRVAGDLADAGLTEGGSEGRASMWRGREAGGEIWRLTFAQLHEPLIASGRLDAGEFDAAMALFGDPSFSSLSPVMMAAWGQRPL